MWKTKYHVLQKQYEQHIRGECSVNVTQFWKSLIYSTSTNLDKVHHFCNVALCKRLKKDEPRLISTELKAYWVIILIIHAIFHIFLTFVVGLLHCGLTLMSETKRDHVQRAHFWVYFKKRSAESSLLDEVEVNGLYYPLKTANDLEILKEKKISS